MATFIVQMDGWIFEWSTIVDAPVTYAMTEGEYREYSREEYGSRYMEREYADRMARVVAKGTSSQVHDSADDVVWINRAGADETCLGRWQLLAWLVAGRSDSEPPKPVGVEIPDDDSWTPERWRAL